MVDSEPESSEDYSPPGQEYTEADEPTFKAINNGNDIITEPSTDRWGTWISAYIPIRHEVSGKTIAVYGMDFDAKSWNNALPVRNISIQFISTAISNHTIIFI